MTKKEIRHALIKQHNPSKMIDIIDNFSDVYSWNDEESPFGNVILFLEVVRQNNLWDRLEKLLEE